MYVRFSGWLLLIAALSGCTALFLPDAERTPTALELSPEAVLVNDQDTASISLTVVDQLGDPFEKLPRSLRAEWSVSDPELAKVRDGRVTGQKQGSGWVQVRVGELVAVAKLTVAGVPRSLRSGGDPPATGVVGRPLASPVTVRVVDRAGTGVADVPVTFKVIAGSGSVSTATAKSDADGLARTVWTLGPRAGENVVEATSTALDGEVVRFASVAMPDAVERLELVSGDQQQATAGAALAQDLVVRAIDKNGNVVVSAAVTWSADGGAVTPSTSTTNEQGIARAGWTLATRARALSAVARAGSAEAKFFATAVPGPAAHVHVASGDQQTGQEFNPLRDSLKVQVTDEHGNPVAGTSVSWAVTHGGGSVATPKPAVSMENGIAAAAWTVGISLPNAVTATALGQSVTFRATARPLVPRDTVRSASGLRYMEIDVSPDSAVVAAPGKWVSIQYTAYLLDGTLVQRAVESPLRFIVGSDQVIEGFDEGVVGMRKSSIRRLIVPPTLGYRNASQAGIPANSTLVFDVKLVDVK